jgi:hypothetical protein
MSRKFSLLFQNVWMVLNVFFSFLLQYTVVLSILLEFKRKKHGTFVHIVTPLIFVYPGKKMPLFYKIFVYFFPSLFGQQL